MAGNSFTMKDIWIAFAFAIADLFIFLVLPFVEENTADVVLNSTICIVFANLTVSTWIVATTPLIAAHEDEEIKEHSSVPLQGTVGTRNDGHLDVVLQKCFNDDVDHVDDTEPHGLLFPHWDCCSTVQVAGIHVMRIFVAVVIMS